MSYPSAAAVRGIVSSWQPVGPRDPSLLVFAYAAMKQDLPASPQALDAWAQQQYAWVAGTHYWDVDFLLAYEQANGRQPSGPPDFTAWLAAQGLAVRNADGSYAKSGQYPIGGTGYPPGGAVASSSSGGAGTGAGTGGSGTAGTGGAGGIGAWVSAHPTETLAIGGGALLLVLVGRR